MPTIILNATNIANYGNGNNRLVYQFQGGGITFKDNDIALAQASLYYSWFNINQSLYKNSTFSYRWVDGTVNNVTIPDGHYSVASLNAFIQSVLVSNLHYLIQVSNGNFIYLIQIQENPVYYAIQLNEYLSPLPATIPATYTYPVGAAWTVPVVATTPQLTVFNYAVSTFGSLIGFLAGSYPATFPYASTFSAVSNTTPQIQPISSVVLTCNLITNPYSTNSRALYSFGIPNTDFGQQILVTPPEFTYNRITNGTYNEFIVEIQDQNGLPIQMLDPQMTILLTIKDRGNNQ
jgi:hypothetical protein